MAAEFVPPPPPQHAFAFLWGNAWNLQTLRLGLVVSTEIIIANVLIYDVFQLLYQVSTVKSVSVEDKTRLFTYLKTCGVLV